MTRATDEQINDLVRRMEVVLFDLGSRLGYTKDEIAAMVNNATVPEP